ncbi:MAG: hypothetical protein IPK12_19650 [Gemmatimonadetes bacterium]|nr:hypothetical protein [Gemmatimonadota bacterium]
MLENPEARHAYDPDAGGGRSLHEQSHGESFLALVLHRLHGNGFYLFDEPEALSPSREVAYRETEHFQVTRAFLEHPERMLRGGAQGGRRGRGLRPKSDARRPSESPGPPAASLS